ncbi:MAG: zeta toxin family protein [Bdellovibrionales bacterium]|nr:zeta toxin family protein [Bdellovibrionales bacterium]
MAKPSLEQQQLAELRSARGRMGSSGLFDGLMQLLSGSADASRDPLLLFALLISVAALLLSAQALASVSRRGEGAGGRKLQERLDELSLLVDDMSGRLNTSRVRIDKRSLFIEEKLKLLEQVEAKVAQLSRDAQERLDDASSYLDDRVTFIERELEELKQRPVSAVGLEWEEVQTAAKSSPAQQQGLVLQLEESATVAPDDDASFYLALGRARSQFLATLNQLLSEKAHFGEATFYRALQELLLSHGFGNAPSSSIPWKLQQVVGNVLTATDANLRSLLENSIRELLQADGSTELVPKKIGGQPQVVVLVGSPGAGTTSICGRLARHLRRKGAKVLLTSTSSRRFEEQKSAADWAGAEVDWLSEPVSAKPRTVAVKALHRGQDEGYDIVLLDTIASLSTAAEQLDEVSDVISVVSREQPGAPHEVLLTVPAELGQHAIEQRMQLENRFVVTGLCVTKLDLAATPGNLVGMRTALNVPIRYVSFGPTPGAFEPFSLTEYMYALFHENRGDYADASDDWSTAPLS